MKKNKYLIELAAAFIITFVTVQSSNYAQSNDKEKFENVKTGKSQMDEYNCPENQDCCIALQENEFSNNQQIDIKQNRNIKSLFDVTDSVITEVQIVEVPNNINVETLRCWNTKSIVSKFCPKCNS